MLTLGCINPKIVNPDVTNPNPDSNSNPNPNNCGYESNYGDNNVNLTRLSPPGVTVQVARLEDPPKVVYGPGPSVYSP